MERLIGKSELARHMGVHPAAITKACRGILKPALRGGRILVDHPAVRHYVSNPGVVSRRKTAQANQRHRRRCRERLLSPTQIAASSTVRPTQPRSHALPSGLRDKAAGATLLREVEDLGELTLREVLDVFGSFEALFAVTKALKDLAALRKTECVVQQRTGKLIERAALAATVFPAIDITQRRALFEMPRAVTEQVIARVRALE